MVINPELESKITEIVILSLYETEINGPGGISSPQTVTMDYDDFKKRAFDKYHGVTHGNPLDCSCNVFYARVKRTALLIFKAIAEAP